MLVLTMLLSASASATATADDGIAVVVARQGPDLSFDRATLREIFLKRIVIDRAGRLLVPVNLAPANPLRRFFSQALLGRSPDDLQNYWNSRYFQGVSPPYVVTSQEAMLRFVAATPGAIGYVASCMVDERVRVVFRLPATAALDARHRALCPGR
jgi:ABC-type phosphate transport system substrate-binding protein